MIKRKNYKIVELQQVARNKIGKINYNDVKLEDQEKDTIKYLSTFGFNIEVVRPTSIPKSNNPDLLISGAIWEIKAPITGNQKTLKKRFQKASKQAGRVIIDLRFVRKNYKEAEEAVYKLFYGNRSIRRMIIIPKNGARPLDIQK